MAKKFQTPIDLGGLEIRNAVFPNLGSAPSSPAEGQFYWNSSSHRPLWWNQNATAWQNIATDSDLLGSQNGAYYRARGNHTGTQTAATISDFDTQVRTSRLDQMAAPTGSVSLNSQKIVNLADATANGDAVNYGQLQSAIQGISSKQVARLATAAALPACTYANGTSGVGATLTGNSNGALGNIDGVASAAGNVLLVKNQSSQLQNGLYVVTQLGDGSNPFILTRVTAMDTAAEMNAMIAVEFGSTLANTLWLSNAADNITVGTDAITFTQLNSPTNYTEGNGINISGLSIAVDAGTGLTFSGGALVIDTTVVVRKYATDVGDGSTTSYTITHNLGTRDVQVTLYKSASTYDEEVPDVLHATTNTITLVFAVAPATNAYRVVVFA